MNGPLVYSQLDLSHVVKLTNLLVLCFASPVRTKRRQLSSLLQPARGSCRDPRRVTVTRNCALTFYFFSLLVFFNVFLQHCRQYDKICFQNQIMTFLYVLFWQRSSNILTIPLTPLTMYCFMQKCFKNCQFNLFFSTLFF